MIQVQRCSHEVPVGASINQAPGLFLLWFDWLLMTGTNGHVAVCTHVIQYPQKDACTEYHTHIVEIHTPLRHTYSGPFHSLNIPLAVSHRRPQLLLISSVTRHSSWASALGGTAGDVVEKGGGVFKLVIVNIFVHPPPPSLTSPPVLYYVTLLRDPCWTAWATLVLPYSAHAFLRLLPFQRFY